MAVKSGVRQVERFARGIADKFNEVTNGIRHGINSGRIESANAGIKRIRSKCCGLFDTDYLFMKMRQMYLSRLSPSISGFGTAPCYQHLSCFFSTCRFFLLTSD